MKKMSLFIISLFLLTSCNSQVKTNKKNIDSIKPKTNISVHKEYDENGNLISVDSAYTYIYSNIKNDSILQKKLFNNFKFQLNNHNKELDSVFMNNFFNDDIFKTNDFYTNDFFEKNIKNQQNEMRSILRMFDSIKNKFYKNRFPLIKDDKSKNRLNKKL